MNLVDYTKTDILDALITIRNICNNNECADCPFSKCEQCLILEQSPCDWCVTSRYDEWKALT